MLIYLSMGPTVPSQARPIPTGRYTFTSWRLWKKKEAPIASGLLGPVRLLTAEAWELK